MRAYHILFQYMVVVFYFCGGLLFNAVRKDNFHAKIRIENLKIKVLFN